MMDRELLILFSGVLGLLLVFTAITWAMLRRAGADPSPGLANLDARVRSWWAMCLIVGVALMLGHVGAVVFFAGVSFLGLREFVTLFPASRSDHRALFWAFFVVLPVHYWFLGIRWYGMFSIFIPVYVFLLIPIRLVLAANPERFLERAARIQWALMACVYLLSHAPALLTLEIPGYEGQNRKLQLFLLIVVASSDVFQYVFGKLFGRRKIAPAISPGKTWAGFVGGIAATTGLGAALAFVTPFAPWQAALLTLTATVVGFFGGLTMSAIKRDAGKKDFGALIPGHGGIMDRVDSLVFASPVFFHMTRYWFTP